MSVIKHLKEIFMEIGVPRCIVSDGGIQLTSQEFKDFTRRWDIQHRITSPTNAQSNGQAEWFCTDYQEQSYQSHGRRGRSTFSHPLIHNNTLEPQSALTHGVAENLDACYHSKYRTRTHSPIQENDATPKTSPSETLQQEYKRSA